MPSRLRALFSQGKTAFGVWIMLSSPAAVEMIASMGFDYVGIDCQHGLLGYEDMRDILLMLRGFETAPVVRVPSSDASVVGRALDAGAEAIVVPMVNSRADAERAAAACRLPPDGLRSFGPARAHQALGRDPAEINREVLCFAMVETTDGLAAVDDICSTPGVDGIYVGPSDLALSLGFDPMSRDYPAQHVEAVGLVLEACRRHQIVPAIHAYGGENARMRAEQGFKMVTVTADAAVLALGSLEELGTARSSS